MPFNAYQGLDQTDEEKVLWHMLENERYVGATLTSSPERTVERDLLGSPDQYRTSRHDGRPDNLDDEDNEDDAGEAFEDLSRRTPRRAHFAAAGLGTPIPPSPSHMPDLSMYMNLAAAVPPPPPPNPPEPSARELAEIKLRQRFNVMLEDLERELGVGRKQRAAPPQTGAGGAAGNWIYGWHPPGVHPCAAPSAEASAFAWRSWQPQQAHAHAQAHAQAQAQAPSRQPPLPVGRAGGGAAAAAAINAAAPGTPDASGLASAATASSAHSPLSDGPRLPRWQPQPSREEVELAMDRLYAAEAYLHFAAVAKRAAMRTWALADDPRPVRRMQLVAQRAWRRKAYGHAWGVWVGLTEAWVSRALKVHGYRQAKRREALRSGWIAWRLERLRGLRGQLETTLDDHKAQGKRQLLRRWHGTVAARSVAYEAAMIKTQSFRRWVLLVHTSRVATQMIRQEMQALAADADEGRGSRGMDSGGRVPSSVPDDGSGGAGGAAARRHYSVTSTLRDPPTRRPTDVARELPSDDSREASLLESDAPSSRRRAHFATPMTYGSVGTGGAGRSGGGAGLLRAGAS